MTHLLGASYFGNTVTDYLVAAGAFALAVAAFALLRRVILGRLRWLARRTDTRLDDLVVELLEMIRGPEQHLLAFYVATRPLVLPGWLDRGFRGLVIAAISYRAVTMIQRLVRFGVDSGFSEESADPSYRQTARAVTLLLNALVWIAAILFVLSNLGFNVSSMIAGLGIGGIAVALAAQAVLGDLFAAVAIFLDRPFVIGDFIVAGDTMGTVEEIGFKTTRVRALSGELLVVPNAALASSRIQNFKRMRERRVAFKFGVVYGTPPAALKGIPATVRGIVESSGRTRFDRAHLTGFGDSSLDFEAVYYVLDPDYNLYADIHQGVLLGVAEAFARDGIEFAFPTRTVVLDQRLAAGPAAGSSPR